MRFYLKLLAVILSILCGIVLVLPLVNYLMPGGPAEFFVYQIGLAQWKYWPVVYWNIAGLEVLLAGIILYFLSKRFTWLQILAIFISIQCGCVFIFSGYSKLFPVESFEYTFVEIGLAGWKSSVFIARLFIGFEFACGGLLILNFWTRRFTIPLVAFTLLVFTVYLIAELAHYGNTGNCGCFGSSISLTPLQGIIKNMVLLLMVGFVYVFHPGITFRRMRPVTLALALVAFSLPFILNPVDYDAAVKNYSGELNYMLDLDMIYNNPNLPQPKAELRKGKWVIAFMSLSCPHCRLAAKKLHVMKMKNPDLPIYLFLNGSEGNEKPFFDDTRATNLPWSKLNAREVFFKLAGPAVPQIMLVNNTVVENKVNYLVLDQNEIEAWLKK